MTSDDYQLSGQGEAQAFGLWLLTQHHRSDWIGNLARAAKADRRFPSGGDPDVVRRYLSSLQAEGEMLEAMDDAERTWLQN
jgi:hypothetical protein